MIRTQISLEKEEYHLAKLEAKRLGLSLAQFFRQALRALLPAQHSRPWMKYSGLVESGNVNSSQEIDDIIYGHKS